MNQTVENLRKKTGELFKTTVNWQSYKQQSGYNNIIIEKESICVFLDVVTTDDGETIIIKMLHSQGISYSFFNIKYYKLDDSFNVVKNFSETIMEWI